jgi:hypothetical protein
MNKKGLIAIVLLAVFAASYWLPSFRSGKQAGSADRVGKAEPAFRKDGELVFRKADDSTFAHPIAIEIADEEWEISQGLMYRSKMDANAGMLFVFDDVRPRSFWMRNTILPLDMLFIGPDRSIVTIQKYTVPFSEESVPSNKPAQYVLEVNAGFCDRLGIREGDSVSF